MSIQQPDSGQIFITSHLNLYHSNFLIVKYILQYYINKYFLENNITHVIVELFIDRKYKRLGLWQKGHCGKKAQL